jgi:uncharacterized protein YkwD
MIRFKLLTALLVLCASTSPVLAEIKFAIGEPTANSTRSGIGQISGWAVSDNEIVSVEALIDGTSLGLVPYGGTRLDVATAFPEYPNSEFSGWAMKWNYSLLEDGEHVATVVITDIEGNEESKDVTFVTTSFKSPFIANPENIRIDGAITATLEGSCIAITGADVEDELVDIELCWDTGSQQFQINSISREEKSESNQSPKAYAGTNRDVYSGETVTLNGIATDPDGSIDSFSWHQLSGPEVVIYNAKQKTASFTAPEAGSTVRIQFTVTDDDGAKDTDDLVIDVMEPEPGPENQPPSANAGSNFTVQVGDAVNVAGQGNDIDGTISSWAWTWVSGVPVSLQNANTKTVSFTAPDTAGTIQLRLTVTDDDGASASDDIVVTVEEPGPVPNLAPTANAGSNFQVDQGEAVTLTGSGSDPDGTIVTWFWYQVSGLDVTLNNTDSQSANFVAPDSAGTIRFRLTVTDNAGDTDTDDVVVTVREAEVPEPEPGSENTSGETVSSMLSAINSARGQSRKCGDDDYSAQPDLKWSSSLADIAMQHSMDMATIGYFSHTSDDGTTMGNRVFPYWSGTTVGENIAASSIDRSNSYVVDLWLTSPGHCALIMSPNFTHAGIGAGHNTDNGYTYHYFWTLDFGG